MEALGYGNVRLLLLPVMRPPITISALLLLVGLHLVALFRTSLLPVAYAAAFSSDPSTNWSSLPDYYGSGSIFPFYRFQNFKACNNDSTYLELLNGEQGLYGRAPLRSSDGIDDALHHHTPYVESAHIDMSLSVSFRLYFVISADDLCYIRRNSRASSRAYSYYLSRAYYLSVVALNDYGNTRDPNKGQVIWTANRGRPVSDNSCLHLGEDSNLKLVEYFDNVRPPEVVWESNTTRQAINASLAINFEGNMILFSNTTDPPYVPLWQSHRHPTDTLMVLQVLQNTSTLTRAAFTSIFYSYPETNYTLAFHNGRLALFARIGQPIGDEESPYGSPYWVWPHSSVLPVTTAPSLPVTTVASLPSVGTPSTNYDCMLDLTGHGRITSSDNLTGYWGSESPEFCMTIPNKSDMTIPITAASSVRSISGTYATILRLESDGDLHAYTVDNTTYPGSSATWTGFYSVFNSTPCDLPLYCGPYGMCDPLRRDGNYCSCHYSNDLKLVFRDETNNKSGCRPYNDGVARIYISLWNTEIEYRYWDENSCPTSDDIKACPRKGWRCEADFLSISNVHYFSLNFTKSYPSVTDSISCKRECEKKSCCSAAFWNGSGSTCFLVIGKLGTIQQQGNMLAFIKYIRNRPKSSFPWRVVGPVLAATLLVACIFFAYWQRRGAREMNELQKERLLLLSLLDVDCANKEKFTWKQMQKFTDGFSYVLGDGGFGSVFRGALPDGRNIAVKQLHEDRSQGQGNKEFIAEVSILSRIHHAHLVRLIGFCLDGNHRLLVYEYMENGSLDTWLFQSNKHVPLVLQDDYNEVQHSNTSEKDNEREMLSWKIRCEIALGTAKGLAYLHEDCEEKIIHMDLKPQNILLSSNFQAKISDFGMSKRTGREQTSVMTVMRGTPGYLAPEWLLDCAITVKCDVYSFGIVLLELVSGRKVKDLKATRQKLRMRPLRESVMLDLLDERLRNAVGHGNSDDVDEKEAVRMVEVALLCVRMDPTKRPEMSRVVWMLEGRAEVEQDMDVLDDDEDDDAMRLQDGKADSFATFMESRSGSSTNTNVWDSIDDTYNNLSHKNSKRKMHKKYIELRKQQHVLDS